MNIEELIHKMENLLLSVKVDNISKVSKCELLTSFGDLKHQANVDRVMMEAQSNTTIMINGKVYTIKLLEIILSYLESQPDALEKYVKGIIASDNRITSKEL